MVRAVARLLQCKTFIPYARLIYQHRRPQTQVHHKTQYALMRSESTTLYGCARISQVKRFTVRTPPIAQTFADKRRYGRERNRGKTCLQAHPLERGARTRLGKDIDRARFAYYVPLRAKAILSEHALRNPEPSTGRQHPGEFGQRDGQRPRKVHNAVDVHQVERSIFYASLGKVFGNRRKETKVTIPRRTSPVVFRRRSTCSSNIARIRVHADDEPRGPDGICQCEGPLAFTATDIKDPLALDIRGDAHSTTTLEPGNR